MNLYVSNWVTRGVNTDNQNETGYYNSITMMSDSADKLKLWVRPEQSFRKQDLENSIVEYGNRGLRIILFRSFDIEDVNTKPL